jgi:hypothetical protein
MDELRDPFRREADAFRVVMMIFGGAAIVIAVALLTRPLFGAIVGAVLIGVGLWRAWGLARAWLQADRDRPPAGD